MEAQQCAPMRALFAKATAAGSMCNGPLSRTLRQARKTVGGALAASSKQRRRLLCARNHSRNCHLKRSTVREKLRTSPITLDFRPHLLNERAGRTNIAAWPLVRIRTSARIKCNNQRKCIIHVSRAVSKAWEPARALDL